MAEAKYLQQSVMLRKVVLNLLLIILLLCVSCATVPVTGRTQLMLVTKEEEEKIGEVALYQFVNLPQNKGKKISSNDLRPEAQSYHRRVNTILGKILYAVGWKDYYKWKYVILDSPNTLNAGMYPGGKLVVFTGILNFAKSDDELAAVIGHEVAHAMARHGAERYSQITATNLTLDAIDAAVASSKKYSKSKGATHVAFGLGVQLGVLLPYSRLHENEADHIGLLIMSKAGYDPQAAIQFWERMERDHLRYQIEFLSTHPSHGTRIANLRNLLPQAIAYKQNPLMQLPEEGKQIQESVQSKSTPEQLYFLGHRFFEEGKYHEAIDYFRKAVEDNPRYDRAYFGMGLCYSKLNLYQDAVDAFKEVIRIRPNLAEAHISLGFAYGKLDRYQEAIESFKEGIRIKPNEFRAYGGLGMVYYKTGRNHEAMEAFNQVIRINPNNATGYDNRGYLYLDSGRYDSAIEDFKKAIELDKYKADPYIGLSIVYFRQKKTEEAKNYYKKASEIEPLCKDGPDALERGKGYFYTESQKQTINEIREALRQE